MCVNESACVNAGACVRVCSCAYTCVRECSGVRACLFGVRAYVCVLMGACVCDVCLAQNTHNYMQSKVDDRIRLEIKRLTKDDLFLVLVVPEIRLTTQTNGLCYVAQQRACCAFGCYVSLERCTIIIMHSHLFSLYVIMCILLQVDYTKPRMRYTRNTR